VTRGLRLPVGRYEIARRALEALTWILPPRVGSPPGTQHRPPAYRLGCGGNDPTADTCATWTTIAGVKLPATDCIGLALWAARCDRYQPGYAGSAGAWLSTRAVYDDARGAKVYFEPVMANVVESGDFLVSPPAGTPYGHIGVVIRPPTSRTGVLVVDASPRHGRMSAIGVGGTWSDAAIFVRYKAP
jgi:hypothetical protein